MTSTWDMYKEETTVSSYTSKQLSVVAALGRSTVTVSV